MSGKESSRVRREHTAGVTSGQTSLRLTAYLEGDQKLEWEVQTWVHGCVIKNSAPGSKVEFLRLWEKSSLVGFHQWVSFEWMEKEGYPKQCKGTTREKELSSGTKKRVVSMPWGVGLIGGRMPVIGKVVTRNAVEQRRDHSEVTGGLSTLSHEQ